MIVGIDGISDKCFLHLIANTFIYSVRKMHLCLMPSQHLIFQFFDTFATISIKLIKNLTLFNTNLNVNGNAVIVTRLSTYKNIINK